MVLLFYMLSLGIFFYFCSLRKKLSTYGSADLRIEIVNNRNGSHIKKDTLFNNLYDFWTRFHDPHKRCFW